MIRILVTGGTFDKEYDEIAGTLYFKDTHVHEMLRLGRCRAPVTVETLMLVDSLHMTDADRQRIADRCVACPERLIVITHGTDTMVETAHALAHAMSQSTGTDTRQLPGTGQRQSAGTGPREFPGTDNRQSPEKTIVLTGAMVPYAFGSSDGMFNLGSAISFVQALAPGVYVAMNGRAFRWDCVRKNRETGVFEEK
jgi:L-asparaginase